VTEALCLQVIRGRTGTACELCRAEEWTDKHHIQNRSQGGLWLPNNVLGLGPLCHDWVTHHPLDAFTGGWTRHPPGSAVWLASLSLWPGWYWLDAQGSPYGYGSPELQRRPAPRFPPHFPPSLRPPARITIPQRSHP
jgi:hypothetical protein